MPNKSDPMAARGVSNKEVGEFTNEKLAHMNSIPAPNARKSSGVDRGTSGSNERPGEGDGEYDRVLKPKMENN
jgi:hypothetical protein